MRTFLATALLAAIATPAAAAPTLIAIGSIDGSSAGYNTDLSGLDYSLENGLPQNVLGMGSGIAYAGGNTFYSLPDRGPNALVYNPAVDNTASYIARFQKVDLTLTKATGGDLAYTLAPKLTGTTLLFSTGPLAYGNGAGLGNDITGAPLKSGDWVNTAGKNYFTGRSDNYNASTNSGSALDARFDPESIRVSNDGKSVFISDEYGPYVRRFDSRTGALVQTYTLPGRARHRDQVAGGPDRDRRQQGRPHRQQRHGRPGDHARRKDAGRRDAGEPHQRSQQDRAHRDDRRRHRRHA